MKLKILITGLLLSHLCFAQNGNPVRGNQQWVQYYGQGELNEMWSLSLDGGFRWKNELEDKSQYIVRVAVLHSLKSGIKLGAGFAHLGFYGLDELTQREYRPYQEIGYAHKVQSVKINHRMRLEERFFDPFGIVYNQFPPNKFTLRWRYGLSANIPLFTIDENMRVSLTLGDEIFLNLDSERDIDFFDQNRLIISPTLHVNENLSFAFTWNRQASYPKVADKHQYNSVIWLQIKHNFNLGTGR